jgi:acyl-CoA synthetase (AMP-forming)/AMP-acid ligase II
MVMLLDQILTEGRNTYMGYLGMERETIESFGGPDKKYFRTGDLGRQDTRGLLHVCGRIKGKRSVNSEIIAAFILQLG